MAAAIFTIDTFRFDDLEKCETAFSIRNAVFVEEQKVSREEEYDSHEQEAQHYLIYSEGKAIGTARMRETSDGVKLERFAILSAYRNKGAGSVLVRKLLEDALRMDRPVYLNAQVAAMNVYARAGFAAEGELFYEAGIPHYRMSFKG